MVRVRMGKDDVRDVVRAEPLSVERIQQEARRGHEFRSSANVEKHIAITGLQ